MSLYAFKIKKKNVEISLSSEYPKLIEKEYNLFLAQLFNVDLEEVKKNVSTSKTATTKKKKKTTVPKVEKVEEIKTVQNVEKVENEEEITTSEPITKLPENFAQMLAKKTTEENKVVEKKTSELRNTYLQMQQVISEKNLENEIDYIVASAYCLNHYEKMVHFTEEQLKAKIAPFFDNEIKHDFILDTVAKNYIRVLPDFTGTSDVTEYELTDIGENYFINQL